MTKSNEWYCYVIHNRKFETIYYAGNRPNEARESLRDDVMNYASSVESVIVGTVDAKTCDDAIEELKDGGWCGDTLPLNGEERQQASVLVYQRREVKVPR